MAVSPLTAMLDDEARQLCRTKIESLEHWLRRLVHETLVQAHGPDYATKLDGSGTPILGKKRTTVALQRMADEPGRYPRLVDAVLLSDLTDLVYSFWSLFQPALGSAFPQGPEVARTFLRRIEAPRNGLSHANAVSIRAMEQVLCYSNDVIESLKDYYRLQGSEAEYDVPLILALRDFRGRVWSRSELEHPLISTNLYLDLSADSTYYLRPGDELALEVEIDPAFDTVPYRTEWGYGQISGIADRRLVAVISEQHIGQRFSVVCNVVTDRRWHRLQNQTDDQFVMVFKVLPH